MMATDGLATPLGATTFDANGDTVNLGISIYCVKSGTFTLAATVS